MALEGTLEDMSLVDLLQVFRLGAKTGTLLVLRDTERMLVSVRDGQPIDAVLSNLKQRCVIAIDEAALLVGFRWERGEFCFRHDPAVHERPARITRDSLTLVLQGLRRSGSAVRPTHAALPAETRLELTTQLPGPETGLALETEHWRVLNQIVTSRTLGELYAQSGGASERVAAVVAELIGLGLVTCAPLAASRRAYPSEARAAGAHASGLAGPSTGGRRLLNAVMRRIRSL